MRKVSTSKFVSGILSASIALALLACGDGGSGGGGGTNNGGAGNPFILEPSDVVGPTTSPTATPDPSASPTATPVPTEVPTPEPTVSNISTSRITSFIWKPESDSTGKLVVLVNPRNVRIEVQGDISETLKDFGPSNGKGTTARANHTGCDFGDNVILEFFEAATGKRILSRTGKTALLVPDGCERVEF